MNRMDVPVTYKLSPMPTDGRRRRQSGKAAKTSKLPPCFICAERATGLHYGVNSCSACKVGSIALPPPLPPRPPPPRPPPPRPPPLLAMPHLC